MNTHTYEIAPLFGEATIKLSIAAKPAHFAWRACIDGTPCDRRSACEESLAIPYAVTSGVKVGVADNASAARDAAEVAGEALAKAYTDAIHAMAATIETHAARAAAADRAWSK